MCFLIDLSYYLVLLLRHSVGNQSKGNFNCLNSSKKGGNKIKMSGSRFKISSYDLFLKISADIILQDEIEISFHKLNDNCTCFNCSFRYRLSPTSLFKHAKEKASEVSAKHVVLEVGFASEASKKKIYIFLGHHHLKSSVLRWRPVLSRFYPGIQQ